MLKHERSMVASFMAGCLMMGHALVPGVDAVSTAHAQCQFAWSSGYERQGGPLDAYWQSIVFDDGNGEALYVCTNGGRVYKYNGSAWQKIGHAYGNTSGVASGICYAMTIADPDGPGPLGRQLFVSGWFRRMASPSQSSTNASTAHGVARWDGTSWYNEGTPQMQATTLQGLTTFDDGGGEKVYLGGNFEIGIGRKIAVRDFNGQWSLVGEEVPSFQSGDEVNVLHAFDDGSGAALYVGGLFQGVGGVTSPGVVKWNGTAWVGLGAGVQYHTGEGGRVYGLTHFDDGSGPKLIASGNIHSSGGDTSVRGVAKWNGSQWTGMGADYTLGRVGPFVGVFDTGTGPHLYAFGPLGNMDAKGVARWNGTDWESPNWDANVLGQPLTINAFDVDGPSPLPTRLIACTNQVMQQDGTTWIPLPSYPASNALSGVIQLTALDADGPGPGAPALYATGDFLTSTNGQPVLKLGTFDGTAWSPAYGGLPNLEIKYGTLPDERVSTGTICTTVFDDGTGPTLYVGGAFNTNNDADARRVLKWDGSAWIEVGGGIGGSLTNGPRVNTLIGFDEPGPGGPSLYACGFFASAGSASVSNIARWDGTAWSDVAGGVDGTIEASVVFDDGSGPALYVAGSFLNAGGVSVNRIAKWDGTTWSALGIGCNGTVSSLLVHDDGLGSGPALYAGGAFTTAGGVSVNRIARWDGSTWSALQGGMTRASGLTGTVTVRSLASLRERGGRVLVAGGSFELADGVRVNSIARWDGTSWSAMQGGMSTFVGNVPPSVTTMAVVEFGGGPNLFAGGTFTSAGPVGADGFARWMYDPAGICCVADVDDGSSTGTPDGGVTIDDLLYYLAIFEAGDAAADVDDGSSTGTPDGGVTIDDLLYFLVRFESGC